MTNITIRIDEGIKKEAEILFDKLGLSMSGAINVFFRQAIREQAIPFQIHAGNNNGRASVMVTLPDDSMKGMLIGRNGRNIGALESLTGVELYIDDTPAMVKLSGADSVSVEIARIALEKLILDGRFHPAMIAAMVEEARKEVDEKFREESESETDT